MHYSTRVALVVMALHKRGSHSPNMVVACFLCSFTVYFKGYSADLEIMHSIKRPG